MNQEQLEALLRQIAPNNQPERLEFSEASEVVEVEEPGAYVGADPVKRKVPVRTLTWIDRGTGQTLKVQVNPTTGTYTKVFQGTDPKMQGAPATTAQQQQQEAGSTSRKPVPGRPGFYEVTTTGQDAQGRATSETHYEDEGGTRVPTPTGISERVRTPVANRPGIYQVTTKNPATGQTETFFENEAGQRIATPTENVQETTTPVTRNQKTYIQHNVKNPDGSSSVFWTDQAGNRVELPDEEKAGAYTPLPPGVPEFTPDFSQPDLGLGARRRQIDQLINQGVIDKKQALEALTRDGGTAKAAGENAGAIVSIQQGNRAADLTARGQDASDIASARSFADSTFNQALSTLTPIGMKFQPGPGSAEAAANGFLASLAVARAHAGESGARALPGYDPRQYPMLAGFGQAGVPGMPGGPPLGTGWFGAGAAPAVPQGSASGPPAVPNALGLGAIGAVPAPGGVPAPAGPAAATRPWTDSATGPSVIPSTGTPPVSMPPPVPLPAPVLPPTPPVAMPPLRDDWRLPGSAPAAPPTPMPTLPGGIRVMPDIWDGSPSQLPGLPGSSPAAGLLQRAWSQNASPGYTGLELGEDLLGSGFDPDVIASVMGRARGGV